jgi:hypothetical protein
MSAIGKNENPTYGNHPAHAEAVETTKDRQGTARLPDTTSA